MNNPNEVRVAGTVELSEINEEGREDYVTGYRAEYHFGGVAGARISIGDSVPNALHNLARRIAEMEDDFDETRNVRIANDILPVGIMEDYREEDTAPARGPEDGD